MASARQRSGAGSRTGTDPIVDSKAEATAELTLEVARCFFRIRAVGQKTGFITSWGGGAFGFMRSLALLGPLKHSLAFFVLGVPPEVIFGLPGALKDARAVLNLHRLNEPETRRPMSTD